MVKTNDYISTKDQLGRPDQTGLFVKKVTNNLKIDDRPLVIESETIGSSWIVGSATNGIVGTNTNTQSGNQQVVGGADRVNTIQRVVNRNNTFVENFINEDAKIATTGTWDTTNQRLVLADTEEATGYYYLNVTNIFNARFILSGNVSNAILYLSSDGTNYEQVTNSTKHGFTNVGQTGKWKIVASGDTITADTIRIEYNR